VHCNLLKRVLSYNKAPKDFAAKDAIFRSSENADFVKNPGFSHFLPSQYDDLFLVTSVVIVTNIFVKNKRSIIEMTTRITNYDVTSDIINTVKITIAVLLTFKMFLLGVNDGSY